MLRVDREAVERYEAWHETPQGAFALARERELLAYLVSGWPSRGRTLLEVGCGPGFFLESFYQKGFDVTGLDASPEMLVAARRRLGKDAQLMLGNAEGLPYDDRSYDYVALLTVLEFCDDPAKAVAEAARVARRGILVGFLNRRSLYYLTHGRWPWNCRTRSMAQARWFSWGELWDLFLSTVGRHPCRARSVLLLPESTWQEAAPWRQLNGLLYPPGWGAYTAARYDLVAEPPLNPLLAWKTEATPG